MVLEWSVSNQFSNFCLELFQTPCFFACFLSMPMFFKYCPFFEYFSKISLHTFFLHALSLHAIFRHFFNAKKRLVYRDFTLICWKMEWKSCLPSSSGANLRRRSKTFFEFGGIFCHVSVKRFTEGWARADTIANIPW